MLNPRLGLWVLLFKDDVQNEVWRGARETRAESFDFPHHRLPALQGFAQSFGKFFNGSFVTAIPSPMALFLGFNQPGLVQDSHVMGDGGLRDVYALLDVTGAKTRFFSQRVRTLGFQSLQDFAASRISDGVEQSVETLVLGSHLTIAIDPKLMAVNVAWILGTRRIGRQAECYLKATNASSLN